MRINYKISEIAKIFNISRRTLIYYDEIGLFKPSYIDEENNYRYYSEHQIYILRFILALKNSGFSLNEIKEYINCKDIEQSQSLLNNKIKIMEENIKKLKNSIKVIKIKSEELKKARSSEGLNPSIIENISFRAIIVDVLPPYRYMQVEKAYKELSQIEKTIKLDEKKHLAILDSENLKKLNIYPLKFVGSVVLDEVENDIVITIKEKKCATITHKDSFESLKRSYTKLTDFIKENSYKIVGDSIEMSNKEKIQLEKGVGEVIQIFIPIE